MFKSGFIIFLVNIEPDVLNFIKETFFSDLLTKNNVVCTKQFGNENILRKGFRNNNIGLPWCEIRHDFFIKIYFLYRHKQLKHVYIFV